MTRITAEWLKKADDDLIAAQYLFQDLYPKQIEISCYHYQQAAEKSLKAFLVHNEIEPPKIHNLIMLCQECCAVGNNYSVRQLIESGANVNYENKSKLIWIKTDSKYKFLRSDYECKTIHRQT